MIINITNNEVISEKEIICRTIFSQARGLMFRKKQNLLMVFKQERKISLHNFFVFYPIDVLIVDSNMNIVEIKENFKLFTLWNSEKKGKYIIELACSGKYKEGDKVKINF